MAIRIMIVDDDPGMRLVLRKAVERSEGFEVAAEAADGMSALQLLEALKPDVVFLDVEMPEIDGLKTAERIGDINPRTILIFATAHEEYMSDAFRLYAFDYWIKPFSPERIINTLARIRDTINAQETPTVTTPLVPREKNLDKLMLRNREGICFVDEQDILLVQREDRSTVIYTAKDRYVTSDGLSELEERLNPQLFMRTHKSYIINLTQVHKIYPYGRWTYIVKLRDTDKDALVTHDKYEQLQKMFK